MRHSQSTLAGELASDPTRGPRDRQSDGAATLGSWLGASTLATRTALQSGVTPNSPRPTCLPSSIELGEVVSRGGMGEVWRATNLQTGKRVAVKVSRGNDVSLVSALKREFRTASELVHPNLVLMHELHVDASSSAISMEWVEGVEFPDALHAHPLKELLVQLVEGLSAIHRAGLVHGDLKGRNVLVTATGRLVILDFGLAQLRTSFSATIGGTPPYMSPEALMGAPATPASDFYALGVMLYEALCGHTPVAGSAADQLKLKMAAWFPHPREIVPSADIELADLAMSLLSPNPNHRVGAEEVLRILDPEDRPVAGDYWIPRAVVEDSLEGALLRPHDAPRHVVVCGEVGSGKTAVVRTVLARGQSRVLWGRCDPLEQVSFRGLDSIADMTPRLLGRMTTWPDSLLALMRVAGRLFPQLVGRPGQLPTARSPSERKRAAAALAELHSYASERAPVVVVVDDIQWLGADGCAVLGEWARHLSGRVTLCTIGRRSSDLDLLLPSQTIEIPTIGGESRNSTSLSIFQQPPPARHLERAHWRTSIGESIGLLPGGVQAAVRWCSIAGGPLEREHFLGLGVEELSIREGVVACVLQLHSDGAHRLVRLAQPGIADVILEEAPPSEADWRRLAEALDDGPSRWAHLASKIWSRIGEAGRAAVALAKAGRWALAQGAFEEAHRMLDRARNLGAPIASWAEPLGQAELALGRVDATLEVWNTARQSLRGVDQVRVAALAATLTFGHGKTAQGMQVLDEMLEGVGEQLPRSVLSAAWRAWGASVLPHRGAAQVVDSSLARARLEALFHAGRSVLVVAPVTGSMILQRHQRVANAVDDPLHCILAAIWQCWSRGSQGRDTSAQESRLDELLRRHHRLVAEQPRIHAEMLSSHGSALLGATRLAEAADAFEQAAHAWRAVSGECWELRFCLASALQTRVHERSVDEMHTEIESFRRYAVSMGDVRSSVELAMGAGIFPHLYRSGSGVENLAYIDNALADWTDEHPPESELRILYARAQAHLAQGNVERALQLIEGAPFRVRALRMFPMARFAIDGLHARILAHRHPDGNDRKLQGLLVELDNTCTDLPMGLVAGIRAGTSLVRGRREKCLEYGARAVTYLTRARQHLLAAGLWADDARLSELGFVDPAGYRKLVFGPGATEVHSELRRGAVGASSSAVPFG